MKGIQFSKLPADLQSGDSVTDEMVSILYSHVNQSDPREDDEEECDEALGSWPLRTFQCKVYKAKSYGQGHPVTG